MAASRRLSAEDGPPGAARRRVAAVAASVVLHVAVLGGAPSGGGRLPAPAPPAAVQVRAIVSPAPVAAAAAPPRPRRDLARAPAPRQGTALPASPPPDALPVETGADDDAPPPVYRTALPPSATLRYDVRRGAGEATAELRWHRDAEGYALDWRVLAGDAALPAQSSRGGVDAAGLAPLRFVDRRAGQGTRAVNFQRDLGRITFSRKSAPADLVPGAQDRLSWILQLAAIVAAEPALRERGREIRMTVAGAGGEVAVWRLRCEGVETEGGRAALRYLRERRGLYDLRAEVWLDAVDGGFLPLRARWQAGGADEAVDLRLREAAAE